MRKDIIFRCDGASHLGLGHVMRCLALADGFRREGFSHITFMSKDYDTQILNKMRSCNFQVESIPHQADLREDLQRIIKMIERDSGGIIITDSYAIDTHYLKELKNTGAFVMCIDDLAQIHFPSDVVLNQNMYASEKDYSVETYTKLLLGTHYTLLRREFLESGKTERLIEKGIRSIMVTMGGGEINNQIPRVLEGLKDISQGKGAGLVVYVIVGVGYHNQRQLHSPSDEQDLQINIMHNPDNLSKLMAEVDIAITAGGSTCYELAYLGVPSIIISIADNQKKIAERLDEEGVSIYLGHYEDVGIKDIRGSVEMLIANSEKRKKMSERGSKLIDGRGVNRIVREVKELTNNR